MSARAEDGRASPPPQAGSGRASGGDLPAEHRQDSDRSSAHARPDPETLPPPRAAAAAGHRPAGKGSRPGAGVLQGLLPGLALAGLAGLGLMATNPDEAEFERFAAERVTEAARQEICHKQGLPLLARLLVQDCPRLIESQRGLLGKLARAASQRRNFGLFSLYRTDLGGQQLLPEWSLPRYRALTLAGAGRFVILRSSQESGADRDAGQPR